MKSRVNSPSSLGINHESAKSPQSPTPKSTVHTMSSPNVSLKSKVKELKEQNEQLLKKLEEQEQENVKLKAALSSIAGRVLENDGAGGETYRTDSVTKAPYEIRVEELETRVTEQSHQIAEMTKHMMMLENSVHRMNACHTLEAIKEILLGALDKINAQHRCPSPPSSISDPDEEVDTEKPQLPPSSLRNLKYQTITVPQKRLPAETHITDIDLNVRDNVIQELSCYKPSGRDWRLLAERIGVPDSNVKLWQHQHVVQPMLNVFEFWQQSGGATVRMLHRHLMSPQLRCTVLAKKLSQVYDVD